MQISLMCMVVLRLVVPIFNTCPRWAEHKGSQNGDMDVFFDRIVFFVQEKGIENGYAPKTVYAPGVLISSDQILTSYNPFRKLMMDRSERENTYVYVLKMRQTASDKQSISYSLYNQSILCARPVLPMDVIELWVGINKPNSPVHDLMVARIEGDLTFPNETERSISFNSWKSKETGTNKASPILTEVANKTTDMGNDVKFASIGFIDDLHIWKSCYLRIKAYNIEDSAIEDCDEWIPREWGHFICITNKDNFQGVGSGAMLFSDNLLFGIGSFFLKKGSDSILVFTDVRPYYDLIFKTCTVLDQSVPLKFYTTTERIPPTGKGR